MKPRDEEIQKMEEILVQAYRGTPLPELDGNWRDRVMRRVREEGSLTDPAEFGLLAALGRGKLVFRFAAFASLAAVILVIYALTVGKSVEQELARFVVDRTADPFNFLSIPL
jgi:hypothetical protein